RFASGPCLVFSTRYGKPKGDVSTAFTPGLPSSLEYDSTGRRSANWYCPESIPSTRVLALGTGMKRNSSSSASRLPAYPLAGSLRALYPSKRTICTYWSGLRSLDTYGPVPTNWVSGLAIESFAMITAKPDGSAKCASSGAYGRLSVMTTVYGPFASRLLTSFATALPRGAISIQRLSDATTSSDVISFPL